MYGRIALWVMLLLLGACAGQGAETSETTTSTVALPTTTTTASPATTTTTLATTTTTLDEWESIKEWRGGPAGEYRTSVFEPAFRFTTSSAFQPSGPSCEDQVSMVKGESGLYVFNLHRGSVEETTESLVTLEGVSFQEPEGVEVGSAPGVKLMGEATGSPTVANVCGGAIFAFAAGADLSVYIVEVGPDTVTMVVESVSGTPSLFDRQVQDIIDSIVWKELSGS